MSVSFAEYIWIDGTKPTALVRSKTKVLPEAAPEEVTLDSFPDWGFDGSSTEQAPGDSSDCVLKPVFFVRDPIRKEGANYLVMCEVWNADGTPHESNTRAKLRDVIGVPWKANADEGSIEADKLGCWFGLEQEHTLFRGRTPHGFPDGGYPAPQGPYYCGVGADEVSGRPLIEAHLFACARAGLKISGINAEVMPGQWEFQIGPAGPLEVGDHLWLARWLLYRLGEDFGINASLDPKPVRGDWNGAGMHANFSTPMMRQIGIGASGEPWGMTAIEAWCGVASEHIQDHLDAYGAGYKSRLTGAHETANYEQFSYGVSDRTASVRIPLQTGKDGYGYLEDRRPNANADPYEVAVVMLKSAYNLW